MHHISCFHDIQINRSIMNLNYAQPTHILKRISTIHYWQCEQTEEINNAQAASQHQIANEVMGCMHGWMAGMHVMWLHEVVAAEYGGVMGVMNWRAHASTPRIIPENLLNADIRKWLDAGCSLIIPTWQQRLL
jgi:hypothetical protein